jgi:hypothetical protein
VGDAAQVLYQPSDSEVDPSLDEDRVPALIDGLHSLADDRVRQHRGSCGAVAHNVIGLDRRFLDQLRSHVLELITQVNFACNGDAVVRHDR